MRGFLISLVCLAGSVCPPLRAQDADAEALPLYRQFRMLSGLPWKEAGATRQTVLARIFHEPHTLVRREVLREYLQTVLPVEEFAAAFDECLALEQADFPGAVPEFVMRAWAERDPAAAVKRCQTLFDLVIEGAPLDFDNWSKPIRTGDLEKARASTYWFGDRGVVHACWKGLGAATLSPERRNELEAEFLSSYARRFQEYPPAEVEEPVQRWGRRYRSTVDHPAPLSTDPERQRELLLLLAATPEEIPGMLQWPREPWNDLLFSRALIRWMNGDASKAPQILERVLDTYDPRRFYRDDPALMDVIPVEFLVEWAVLDRDAFMAWEEKPHRGWRAQAVFLTVMSKENDYKVRDKANAFGSKELKSKGDKLWITLDPDSALPALSGYGDTKYTIDGALEDLWNSDPPANYWRGAVAPYIHPNRRGGGVNEAWGVTMVWAPVDFRAMVKQYGMPWCLHSGEFKGSQVPAMLSNRLALENDSGLRHTLSALRTWAILRPKEMRAWIDGEKFSPDLREALRWLLDNAGNGLAVPAPAKVP